MHIANFVSFERQHLNSENVKNSSAIHEQNPFKDLRSKILYVMESVRTGGNFVPAGQQIAGAFRHFIILNVRMFFSILIMGNQRLFHHNCLPSCIYSKIGELYYSLMKFNMNLLKLCTNYWR